jgi:hypothetical protein
MKWKASRSGILVQIVRNVVAIICALVLVPGDMSLLAQAGATAGGEEAARIPAEQLDSLVAPIALYPDPMLTQTLVASTYPLEIIQLQQWLGKNKNLKDQALTDAVKKQNWDPSIQAMAALPDVVKQMAENIQWTTDLGNAFLAQQADVMDAVQRMRKKAKEAGNLKSSEQQKVQTQTVESKQVIVIEQASPQVVYVPSYNPTVVYGAPAYPYPPIAYPPPGYYAAGMAISFGVGVAMGAAWGGGWGYGAGWGHNDVDINVNNTYNRNTNVSNSGNRAAAKGGNNTWQHNPQHRGGAPYSNQATANKYGGSARGDSMASRQERARQNQGQRADRQPATAGDRSASGGRQQAGASDRSAGGRDASNRGTGTSNTGSNRGGGGGGDPVGNRSASSGSGGGGGGDRVGNRSVSSGSGGGSRSSGAFGDGSGGYSGSSARSSSSRGSSSMGASRGGGGRRR